LLCCVVCGVLVAPLVDVSMQLGRVLVCCVVCGVLVAPLVDVSMQLGRVLVCCVACGVLVAPLVDVSMQLGRVLVCCVMCAAQSYVVCLCVFEFWIHWACFCVVAGFDDACMCVWGQVSASTRRPWKRLSSS
jgi:hypothetical protein